MNIETLLNVEIEGKAIKLANLEPGTKEYSEAVDSLAKLMDRRIEIAKLEQASAQKEKEAKEERKARRNKLIVEIGGVVLTAAQIGVTIWGVKKSFQFEEKGTITTQTGRKLMDRLFKR